jgi:dTDP-4-dehydrorhamnose reductase
MKILVAGAGGLVGSEFVSQLSSSHEVIARSHHDLDVTDRKTVAALVSRERPELIINCAVLGVDACELDPARAVRVNVTGTENLARAALAVQAEFLQLSTNYVFDGERNDGSPYSIADAPDPVNVYGETKLAGERAATAACERSYIVRTSWVFGPSKASFFNMAISSLISRRHFRAVIDVWASATYVRDLVLRAEEILTRHRHATYHVVNDDNCTYHEFAHEVARLLQVSETDAHDLILPATAAEVFPYARRPRFTPMRCLVSEELGLTPMRNWRIAAADYVERFTVGK